MTDEDAQMTADAALERAMMWANGDLTHKGSGPFSGGFLGREQIMFAHARIAEMDAAEVSKWSALSMALRYKESQPAMSALPTADFSFHSPGGKFGE